MTTRTTLARRALNMALEVRTELDADFAEPLNAFAACAQLGVKVKFVPLTSMEGMYVGGGRSLILLPAERPLVRKVFTAAHELGHHRFGHGVRVDESMDEADEAPTRLLDDDEWLAEAFAGALLMPQLGVQGAFAARRWRPESATPAQVFTVACAFGVGYTTLVHHMSAALRLIPPARSAALRRERLPEIRASILGADVCARLVVVDEHYVAGTVDTEVGTHVLLPVGSTVDGDGLRFVGDLPGGRLVLAECTGLHAVQGPTRRGGVIVRVSRHHYLGLARWRHFEPADDEGYAED